MDIESIKERRLRNHGRTLAEDSDWMIAEIERLKDELEQLRVMQLQVATRCVEIAETIRGDGTVSDIYGAKTADAIRREFNLPKAG